MQGGGKTGETGFTGKTVCRGGRKKGARNADCSERGQEAEEVEQAIRDDEDCGAK